MLLLLLSASGDGYKDCGGGGDRVQQGAKVSKLLEGELAPGGDGGKEADDADDGDGNDGDIGAVLTGDNLASSSSDW